MPSSSSDVIIRESLPAIGFYEKSAFTIESARRASILIDGRFHDEFCLGRLLAPAAAPATHSDGTTGTRHPPQPLAKQRGHDLAAV